MMRTFDVSNALFMLMLLTIASTKDTNKLGGVFSFVLPVGRLLFNESNNSTARSINFGRLQQSFFLVFTS